MEDYTCDCCGESVAGPSRYWWDPTESRHCEMCEGHQGNDLVLKKEFEHSRDYKRRLEETRGRVNGLVQKTLKLKTQLTAAERDRDRLITEFKKAGALHRWKADRSCTCGLKKCSTVIVVEDPWIRQKLGRNKPSRRAG